MSLKGIKQQIAALREEIGDQGRREWITVRVPLRFTDEEIADWLVQEVETEWRRHVIVRLTSTGVTVPKVVSRVPVSETAGVGGLVFSAAESALL